MYFDRSVRIAMKTAAPAVYLEEDIVRKTLSRRDVLQVVKELVFGGRLRSGFSAESTLSSHSLGAKGGAVTEDGFGVKIRAGKEGNYLTVIWSEDGHLVGFVEAAYLTYARTAAALLLVPAASRMDVRRVLVMGAGRLGSACSMLASELFSDAELRVWSRNRSEGRDKGCWEGKASWWTPLNKGMESFDVVLTCTPSTKPLPLHQIVPSYVGVGGAVNSGRRELPPEWVRRAKSINADDPRAAMEKCGDLRGVSERRVRPLEEAKSVICGRVDSPALTFICGSGAFDVGLALECCRRKDLA